jgi:hypothetical protein
MKLLLFTLAIILSSCAHHRDVRPSAKGVHLVRFNTEDKSQGYSNAIAQARHFCEQEKGNAYVVKEGYKYVGDMDEKTYKNTKTASKIASGVGGAAFAFGGEKESNAGGILGLGGGIANSVAGQGYQYSMKFKCK